MNTKALPGKVALRVLIAFIFTGIWYVLNTGNVMRAAPFAFFSMLYVCGAWLHYLRVSGFIFLKNKQCSPEAEQETNADSISTAVTANIIAAIILAIISFIIA